MTKVLQFIRSVALLIARVGLGGILIAHGYRRWQVQGVARQVAYLSQYRTPYPEVVAWGAILLELVGGVFLIVGALTPLVALGILVEQILIIAYTNWAKKLYLLDAAGAYVGGYEYNVVLGLLALLFLVFGAGGAAVDRLFRRSPADPDQPVDDRSIP
jgi:putative oxidoreductase